MPPEDAKLLEAQNGTYTIKPTLLMEGIYGAVNNIESSKRYTYANLDFSKNYIIIKEVENRQQVQLCAC